MSFYEYILFNILGFSPLLLSVVFILNSAFKEASYYETYRIESRIQHKNASIYQLEGNVYENKEYLRTINNIEEVEVRGSEYYSIYFSNGLLGIRIIEKKLLH